MLWKWIYNGTTSYEVQAASLSHGTAQRSRGPQRIHVLGWRGWKMGAIAPVLKERHWALHPFPRLFLPAGEVQQKETVFSASLRRGSTILTEANAQHRLGTGTERQQATTVKIPAVPFRLLAQVRGIDGPPQSVSRGRNPRWGRAQKNTHRHEGLVQAESGSPFERAVRLKERRGPMMRAQPEGQGSRASTLQETPTLSAGLPLPRDPCFHRRPQVS